MMERSPIDYQARLKETLLALTKVRSRLEALERQQTEPIAIIGIGCRFPGGVTDPESFWDLLFNGVDAISEVPADRWDIDAYYGPDPGTPGKMYTRYGGFIHDVDQFDPTFFGISPREANSMDPQQRLLLEVAWEALENAGQAPDQLGESPTGVYIGVTMNDYVQVQSNLNSPDLTGTYRITGNLFNSIAGRISYTLGLHGPAMAIDTACSSSLVTIHQAVQSLRSGETDMVLAGGVNLILSPEITLSACQANMLAPDGRCKTFDSRADGFIRSDGIGVVVMKRLSDALQNGDQIWALIRGSSVNHDGFSSGFSVPNKLAQEAAIKAALKSAGVAPQEIGYVETHGTGTSLGDPIEVRALEAALTQERSADSPLYLGSVKTNFGHTEAAAGVAGLIKAVLALQHKVIPPHLHLQKLNPFIEWSKTPLLIPTKPTEFPSINGHYLAGVSSFGVSGINAHIILEAAPDLSDKGECTDDMERPVQLLCLSAQTEIALQAQAERHAAYLQKHPDLELKDICYSANTGRANFRYRLAVTATSSEEMQRQLSGFDSGADISSVVHNVLEPDDKLKIAFLFTGHGSQYVNMGRGLYEDSPVFSQAVRECEDLLLPYLDIPISKMMYPEPGEEKTIADLWDGMKYTQPAQFVLAYALVKLWKSWGIEPGVVIGHSVGEYAAACAAGMMNLEDGIKLVATRGRLMDSLPQKGVMAAVFADEATVKKALAPHANQVSIAVINGPTNTVISGNAQVVETILAELAQQEIKSKRLDVAQASHSSLVDPMLDEFESIAKTINFQQPRVEFVSCLTGELRTSVDSMYWRRHQRQPVRFAESLQTVLALGYNHLIEIGPTPTLITIAQRNLDESESMPDFYPSLRKGMDDWEQALTGLAGLYVHGADVDWRGFDQPYPRRRVTLPNYPFQRQRYWVTPGLKRQGAQSKMLHPLLGMRLQSAVQEIIFENELSSQEPAFLADHVVQDQVILPATGYMEMLLAAGHEIVKDNNATLAIDDLVIHRPGQLSETEMRTVQTIVEKKTDNEIACQIFSHDAKTDTWQSHANAVIRSIQELPKTTSLAEIQLRCKEMISGDDHYQRLAERGISFGPAFRGVNSLRLGKNEALAQIESPESVISKVPSYYLHPAILDAALQTVAALLPSGNKPFLPISADSIKVFGRIPSKLWSHATLETGEHSNNELLTANIDLYDETGKLLVAFGGFTLKQAVRTSFDKWLYEIEWQKAPKTHITPHELAALLQSSLDSMAEEPTVASYEREFLPRMDTFCAALIQNILLEMGWSLKTRAAYSLKDVSSQLGVAKQHQRLLKRLLEILEEDGALARQGENWKVVRPLVRTDTSTQAESLRAVVPDAAIEVDMVERIGQEFAPALQGHIDPLELLFPGGSLAETEKLYHDAPFTRSFNQLMGQAVKEFANNWHKTRPIRILEIGAGTGGTTAFVLNQLSGVPVEYTFTDISPLFLNKAKEKLSQYDFVQYQTLDIEQDPIAQDFEPHGYDLVLATNVLHATTDLHETVRRVHALLAPEGFLFAVEGTRKQRFADIIVGLTPGWWAFSDNDLRPSYALLSQSQWLNLFEEADFASAQGITGQEALSNQSLLVAQAKPSLSVSAAGKWLLFTKNNTLGNSLAEKLREQNQTVQFVNAGNKFAQEKNSYQIAARRVDDFHKLI